LAIYERVTFATSGNLSGEALAKHSDVNGILFTGSWQTGRALHQQLAGRPDVLLALEMGGNNPLLVTQTDNIKAAVQLTIQSAYISSGQRCTCARRLIVPQGSWGDQFIDALKTAVTQLSVGHYRQQPEPFMGPVVSLTAAKNLLTKQQTLLKQGGQTLVEMQTLQPNSALLSPGLIDVTKIKEREDEEIFGPLLQIIRVKDFAAGMAEANNTQYGLVAGLISDDRAEFDQFYREVRAGLINWNRPTTGASSELPFGGLGHSGNHRPSAYYAADYCAEPIVSLQSDTPQLPESLPPGMVL